MNFMRITTIMFMWAITIAPFGLGHSLIEAGGGAVVAQQSVQVAAAAEIQRQLLVTAEAEAEVKAVQVAQPTLLTSGFAAHYSDGIMESVAVNRGMQQTQCMISYTWPNSAMLGQWVQVESLVNGAWLSCLVVDMPMAEHYHSILGRGIVIELGMPAARLICSIQTYGQEPPRACPVNVYQ